MLGPDERVKLKAAILRELMTPPPSVTPSFLVRVFGTGPLQIEVAPLKHFRYDAVRKAFWSGPREKWSGDVDAVAYAGGNVPRNL